MKFTKILMLLCILLCFSCKKATEIKGDVFVVTQGAGSYKLGLVQVTAIPRKKYDSYILEKKITIEDAKQKYAENNIECGSPIGDLDGLSIEQLQRLRNGRQNCIQKIQSAEESLESIFVGMPNISAAATTDADGKFTLIIPKQGEYVLVAKAQRMIGEDTEKYYWTVPVKADGQATSVMLSNNNKTGLANLENLIPATNK